MKNTKYYIIGLTVALLMIAGVSVVKANKLYFISTTQTSSATTSPDYMRATNSVLILDAFANANYNALNSATLLVQSTASTSNAVQTITINYSQDGIDWYNDTVSTTTSASGIPLNNTQRTYVITGNTTASTTRLAIIVPTPTRYIRATVATSTALSSVWLRWVPVREVNE
jgi:UDP-N-acetylmuramoylalanine-D-glutamate ligase